MQRNPEIADLLASGLIHGFDGAMDWLPRHEIIDPATKRTTYGELDGRRVSLAMDSLMAMDAPYSQPGMITTPNAGIPALLTTYVDPKLIEVILQPLKAAEIYGEAQKGDWTTDTAMFGMVEMTGGAAAYGDFSQNGRSDANTNWPQRQNFGVQTMTEWGDREVARMALAKVDWAARKNISSANTLNRWMNAVFFYGVGTSLQNYGALNDPALPAALTPATKAAGGTSWQNALPTEILADVQTGYFNLQTQSGGNIDRDSALKLVISPQTDTYVANTNSFGLTASEMLKKAFPNLTIETAPQLLSGTTYSYQMFVEEYEGQRSVECVFAEKMRAHRMVMDTSSQRQKKSAFAWGTLWYRPMFQVQMAGI